MREDLSGLAQAPAGPAPKKQPGQPIDLVALAEDMKTAVPKPPAPEVESLLRGQPARGGGTVTLPRPIPETPEAARARQETAQEDYLRHMLESEKYGPTSAALEIALQNLNPDREMANRMVEDILQQTQRKALGEHATLFGAAGGISEAARVGAEMEALGPVAEAGEGALAAGAARVFPRAAAAIGRATAPVVQDLGAPALEGAEASLSRRLLANARMRVTQGGVAAGRGAVQGAIAGGAQQTIEGQRPEDILLGAATGAAFGAGGSFAGGVLRGRPTTLFGEMAPGGGGAADPFRVLGLNRRTATPEDVQAAYVEAAKRTHPDVAAEDRVARGGSADPVASAQEFQRAKEARDAALDALRTMPEEQLAQHPLGRTPPMEESAAAPGVTERRASQAMGRAIERERRAGEGPGSESPFQPRPLERRIAPDRAGGGVADLRSATGAPLSPRPEAVGRPSGLPGRMVTTETGPETRRTPAEEGLRPQAVRGEPPSSRLEAAAPPPGLPGGKGPVVPVSSTSPSSISPAAEGGPAELVPGTARTAPLPQNTPIPERAPVDLAARIAAALAPHQALHTHARITFEAAADDPLKGEKEALAAQVAGDGPSFAPIARMRQVGATDTEIAEHLRQHGSRSSMARVALARQMFQIPKPGGKPTTEMPARSAAALPERAAVEPEAGAPHDQAAVQEALPGIGQPTLAGKEQAELLAETAGVPTQKLKPTKMAPEEVGRVKREGAEPAGERPMELAPEKPAKVGKRWEAAARGLEGELRGKPSKQAGTEKLIARHGELTAQIARDEQIMGAGTHQGTFTDVNAHIGQPGQKFVTTKRTGPAYAATGRLAQARKRLADLEKTMTPEELATAREKSEAIASTAAEEANERVTQGGTSAELERQGIQREAEREKPDYEALAAKQAGPIPPGLKDTIEKRLIEYGDTKEELDKRGPLDLANRALELEVLTPKEESNLLDAIWPDMGALLAARRKGQPIPDVTTPQQSVRDAFRKLFYPEKRGLEAQTAGRLLRRAIGEMRRDIAVYRQQLKDARHQVPSLKTAEGIAFYDRAENGVGQVKPELERAVGIIRKIYDGLVRDIQALGTGRLAMPIENYMAHGWKDPAKAKQVYRELAQSQARRPLAGSKAFLKERTIPRLVDGLRKNLEPITDNAIDLNLWKMDQMRKYLFAQRFMQDAKEEEIARFFRVGENLPDGWGRIEDPTFAVYGRSEAGELVLRGHWGMPTIARDLVNNYLSPGLRGNPLADAWLGAANSMVQFKLGASGFHAGFSTYTGAVSRTALAIGKLRTGRLPFAEPTKGGVLGGAAGATVGGIVGGPGGAGLGAELGATAGRLLQKGLALKAVYLDPGAGTLLERRLAELMARGGGQHQMPGEYRTSTVAALKEAARKGNLPKALAHTVGLALQTLAWPTMQFYVPLIKMGAFSDLMQSELDRLGPLATEAQADEGAQKVWHSIDNRFGQVSYDTRFWNNAMKHVLMGTIQAVGWDAGTVDELVGGLKEGITGKPSLRLDFLLALPLTVALINVLIQLALTGEGPNSVQDLFEPRNGKVDEFGNAERMTPATYMKDIIGFARHPVNTVVNKLNPLVGFVGRLLSNRYFYPKMWRNKHDPVSEQLKQAWKFARDEWTPISIKNVQEETRRGVTGGRGALPMVGITPAGREAIRTKAQNMMIQMLRERTPARTPEEQEAALEKRAEREGLSPEQRLVGMFRKLSPDQRHQVHAVANEQERELFNPYVERRMRPYKR
jgi:hypothetical protein